MGVYMSLLVSASFIDCVCSVLNSLNHEVDCSLLSLGQSLVLASGRLTGAFSWIHTLHDAKKSVLADVVA